MYYMYIYMNMYITYRQQVVDTGVGMAAREHTSEYISIHQHLRGGACGR
jgi:hypothetical protein